jgi:hypothetical protein
MPQIGLDAVARAHSVYLWVRASASAIKANGKAKMRDFVMLSPRFPSSFKLLSKAALIGLMGLWVAAPRPAEAQVVESLFNFFGVHEEKPEVEYRERAPLVVPPKTQLRPPQEAASSKHAAWPKDPDAQRRKAAAAGRMPVTETEEYKRAENPHLPIDQMRAGRKAGAGVTTTPAPVYGDSGRDGNWIHPDNLRALHAKAQSASGQTGGGVGCNGQEEPSRRYLTEPPTGLRKCIDGFQGRTTRGAINAGSSEDPASPFAVLSPKKQSDD